MLLGDGKWKYGLAYLMGMGNVMVMFWRSSKGFIDGLSPKHQGMSVGIVLVMDWWWWKSAGAGRNLK